VPLVVVEHPEASSEAELVAACVAGDAAAQRRLCLREYALAGMHEAIFVALAL